jgi:SAM-dependent methyltransferase
MKKLRILIKIFGSTRFLVRRLQRRFITKETEGKKFCVVVDIGCGTAPYRKFIVHEKYIGVDIENRGGVPDEIIADVNEGIPLPDATADLVLCTETLEHTKRPHAVVFELWRITKSGGMVLLTIPMVWPVHEAPYDFFRYTNYGLEYLFKGAGFTSVRIEASNGYGYTLLQLCLLYLRHRVFRPIVWVCNIFGVLLYETERNRNLPLGYSVVAIK